MEQYIFAPTVCGAELEEELAAAIESGRRYSHAHRSRGCGKKRTPSIAMRRGAAGGKEFYARSFRGC